MWTYSSADGTLLHDGVLVGECYSGNGAGLNNPGFKTVADVGPIPRGRYTIGEFFDDPGGKGILVAHLTPAPSNQMWHRAGFMIHGDNRAVNHTASHGCIIAAHSIRLAIQSSLETLLEVI